MFSPKNFGKALPAINWKWNDTEAENGNRSLCPGVSIFRQNKRQVFSSFRHCSEFKSIYLLKWINFREFHELWVFLKSSQKVNFSIREIINPTKIRAIQK